MFLFGHSPSLVKDKSSRMWPQVLEVLQSKAQFGVGLPLKCKNHPNTITEITSPEQFDQFVGDGGCSLRCAFRLSCGHQCPRRCHPDDVLHVASYCPMPCSRLRSAEDCPYQHPCPLLCGDSCGPCKVPITSVLLPCGHSARNVACHQANKPADIFCTRKVSFDMKGCGHTLEISCGEVQKFNSESACDHCFQVCGKSLHCGHACSSECGACHTKGNVILGDGSKVVS